MRSHGLLGLAWLGAGALIFAGCSGHMATRHAADQGAGAGLRPTNVELYILSQSCFQGEVVPCG